MTTQQADQYAAFKRGEKNLCVLERRKDQVTFQRAITADYNRAPPVLYHRHLWHSPEGIEVVLGHIDVIQRYIETLHDDNLWDWHPDKARRRLGKMFGYLPGEISTFVANWTPEYCMCSKCVGVKRAKDYNLRREQREAK